VSVLTREACEQAFHEAVRACDPERRVREALEREPVVGTQILGLAVGKAALAMSRGAGPVARGLVVSPFDDNRGIPDGWQLLLAGHPVPDERSVAAALAAIALVESARAEDHVLALISGGASALIEQPRPPYTLEELVSAVSLAMAHGASIRMLNARRTSMSAIKGGQLAERSLAPVTTLVVSDVIGDNPHVIGSGPTVSMQRHDRVEVIAPMRSFGEAMAAALGVRRLEEPVDGPVENAARGLFEEAKAGPILAWGETVVALPENHGTGGRAQQLALHLARLVAGTDKAAFVAGSDGVDGPTRAAGAYVDGTTWDAIARAGIDPDHALVTRDSTAALAAVDALVITGPTGINHADVIAIG
jgi:hydroxypyruvate reductase